MKNLSYNYSRLFAVTLFFCLSTTFSDSFINLFIYSKTGGAYATLIYKIGFGAAMILFTFVHYRLSAKVDPRTLIRTGIGCFIIKYIIIILLGDNIGNFVFFAGALYGISCVFYYVTLNSVILKYNEGDYNAQGKYMSILQLYGATIGFVIPPLSGTIVEKVSDIGYNIVFSISIVIFILAFLATFRLPRVNKSETPKGLLKQSVVYMKIKKFRYAVIGEFYHGFYQGNAVSLVSLMFFMIVKSEMASGFMSIPNSVLSIVGGVVAVKTLKPRFATKISAVGTTIFCITSIICFIVPNVITVTIFVLFNSLLTTLVENSITLMVSKGFEDSPIVGYACREVSINIGRILGSLIMIPLSQTIASISLGIIILSVMQYLAIHSYSKILKTEEF